MKEEIIKAIIIGVAIIIAAAVHASIQKNVGRYQGFTDPRGVLYQVDTVSGEIRDSNNTSFKKN